MSAGLEQPETPIGQRVLQIAREALPDEAVRAAFQGMVRPAPWVVTTAPALIVIVIYALVAVVIDPPPALGLITVVVSLVVVLLAFMRFFVTSALFVITPREIIVLRYSLGRAGDELTRGARDLEIDAYWDRRYSVVQVGGLRAFVTRRLYGDLLDQLSA